MAGGRGGSEDNYVTEYKVDQDLISNSGLFFCTAFSTLIEINWRAKMRRHMRTCDEPFTTASVREKIKKLKNCIAT
jgi:hypothetical protein